MTALVLNEDKKSGRLHGLLPRAFVLSSSISIFVLFFALACSSGDEPDTQAGAGATAGSNWTATGGIGNTAGAGGKGSGASGAVAIVAVDAPSGASGDIPLLVRVRNADSATLSLTLDVSLDGATWKAARSDASAARPAADGAVELAVTLTWHSLREISFHKPQSVRLRVTPTDRSGRGQTFALTLPVDNLRAAARQVNWPLFFYGAWDPSSLAIAKRHDLVVIHPGAGNLTRALVQELQLGADSNDPADDVIVLGYVTVGEDDRVERLTDEQARSDSRFDGDGTGPRVDPRGPTPESGPLGGINPLGNPSPAGTGWASFYLDDNSVALDGVGDGIPDRNTEFGGYFVNAGDPKWFDMVNKMTLDSPDKHAGLEEVLTTSYGRGLGCDGVFLDTLDTAAPNSWTSPADGDYSQYEWTGPGMSAFVARLHATYPDRLVLQNRGNFFLNVTQPQYAYTTRGSIDYFLYESYRLDSSGADGIHPVFYPDSQYNVTPKLMAEAGRPDGFRVLSIGYVEGTGLADAAKTLLGQGNAGFDSLLEDIRVTERVAGFRHYITNAALDLVNSFVRDHSTLTDTDPPVWSSVWNENRDPSSGVAAPPTPRVGIQKVLPGAGQVTVQWDVALDYNQVGYALYYSIQPLNSTSDPKLTKATRAVLIPEVPQAYVSSFGPDVLPYQDTITGLKSGQVYNLIIRAFDAVGNEDANTVTLTVTPR